MLKPSQGQLYGVIILSLLLSLLVTVLSFFMLSTDNKLLEERINLLQNDVDALKARK